jgi:hypothetical protein
MTQCQVAEKRCRNCGFEMRLNAYIALDMEISGDLFELSTRAFLPLVQGACPSTSFEAFASKDVPALCERQTGSPFLSVLASAASPGRIRPGYQREAAELL